MTDDCPVQIEHRAPVNRRRQRNQTRFGVWLAVAGWVLVFLPIATTGDILPRPALVGLVFFGGGLLMARPGVFKPVIMKVLDNLHLLRRGP